MRHRKAGAKLNRTSSHKNAMMRNMVTSLLKYERIRTTDAKAKELRRWVDHLITLAKRGDLHARRQALSIVREKSVVHKLFQDVVAKFSGSSGGYTRLIKVGIRPGDTAPLTMVELITPVEQTPKKKPAKAKSKTGAKEVVKPAKEKSAAEQPEPDKTAETKQEAEPEKETVKEAERVETAPPSAAESSAAESENQEENTEPEK